MHALDLAYSYADDDPPFFLRNKSSSDDSVPKQGLHLLAASNNAYRRFPGGSSMSRNRHVESSSEDFRSVIDDLTIENRRLRKKLQKYEQLHCGNLQNDKLFEIRVHGLPASKKRRLERTLQDFASSLGDTGDEELPSPFAQKLSRVPNRRLAPLHHASSSSTSNSRPVDSAYVSMSTSGGNSDARLQKVDPGKSSGQSNSNDQNVRSYLQTISRGLLPKHPPVMTEKAKKQLVVQRLEQLYTGSKDSSNQHSQSMQQQEVSQSAANADRRESEARGHQVEAEGSREAKIYLFDSQTGKEPSALEQPSDDAGSRAVSASSGFTPDQRPTRPLDLDPSRAQNPEENIEYMKHLGFDLPAMKTKEILHGEEGWVYLNLLINMAQLHSLNVTPDFVRSSIRDFSTKFELSPDGSRIRWKGGNEGTKLTIDSGDSSEHSSEPHPYELGAPRDAGRSKSSKPSTEIQSGISGNIQSSNDPTSGSYNTKFDRQRPLLLGQTSLEDPHQYRPIFYHARHFDEDESYSVEEKDSPFSSVPLESSTAFDPDGACHGHAAKTAAKSKIRRGVDPIIFYNRARFYTDLSKDDESMPYNCPLYNRAADGVIGGGGTHQGVLQAEEKGVISQPLDENSLASLEQFTSNLSLAGFVDGLPRATRSTSSESDVKPFEVSGIGGVVPGDNFAIQVSVQHQKRSKHSAVQSRILSTRRTDLLPSSLPPPSYAFLPFSSGSASDEESSNGDNGSEGESDDTGEEDIGHFVPPKFLNNFSSDTTQNTSSNDQESDDSSIDLLAHARQIEPEEVAAREREFEENISKSDNEGREMDVDPPASSVVATVGEQSNMEDGVDATKEHRISATSGQKRPADGGKGGGKVKQRRVTPGT